MGADIGADAGAGVGRSLEEGSAAPAPASLMALPRKSANELKLKTGGAGGARLGAIFARSSEEVVGGDACDGSRILFGVVDAEELKHWTD